MRSGVPFGCAAALFLVAPALGAAEPNVQQKMALGRKVFTQVAQPPCGLCHALKDAGTGGKIGPSLDELKPDANRVRIAVRNGAGVMPAFKEQLTPEQIQALAVYVARAAGSGR